MNVLITGITGYVGSRLAARLARDGHAMRGLSSHAGRRADGACVVGGDAVSGDGLEAALEGIDVAYFLIHSMERSHNGSFALREHEAAENFARAAAAADVSRIIYLGGL